MLDYSLVALFGALLPYLVFSIEVSEPLGWRIVSGTSLAVSLTYGFVQGTFLREMAAGLGRSPAGLTFGIGDLAIGLLAILNVSGLLFEPQALPHVASVFYNLGGASFGFVRLVTMVWSNDET